MEEVNYWLWLKIFVMILSIFFIIKRNNKEKWSNQDNLYGEFKQKIKAKYKYYLIDFYYSLLSNYNLSVENYFNVLATLGFMKPKNSNNSSDVIEWTLLSIRNILNDYDNQDWLDLIKFSTENEISIIAFCYLYMYVVDKYFYDTICNIEDKSILDEAFSELTINFKNDKVFKSYPKFLWT